jgi:selT/selW/selH-like putative selenoprotein
VAEEILAAVPQQITALHMVPVTGGRFEIEVDGQPVFDAVQAQGFPKPGEAATLVRGRLSAQGSGSATH